jgi:hypothetical protein
LHANIFARQKLPIFLPALGLLPRVANISHLEYLQQFDKLTWHSSNFGKTRKICLQQFGKQTWQK